MQTSHSYFIFLLKTIILTFVFSIFGIIFFGPPPPTSYTNTEEKNTPGTVENRQYDNKINKKEANQILHEIVDATLEKKHYSALSEKEAKKKYQKICSWYKTICKKTTRDGQYSENEKIQYQALVIYLIEKESEYIQSPLKLKDLISYLKIYEDKKGRRGSAGHTHIRLNSQKINNGEEFRQVLSHEIGHIIDFSVIKGTSSTKDAIFTEFGNPAWSINDPSLNFYKISWKNENTRKNKATSKDFVSGYAMKGVYEDFAESIQLRFNHHDYFKNLSQSNIALQKKYNYISKIYHDKYFTKGLHSSYPSIQERKRDSTKLK